MMALSSVSVIPEADKILGRAPMYTLDQLAPIALISADPTILVVRAESPWKSVKDLVDDAKKRPGAISYSSSGIYGTLHVAMAMLADAAGVSLHHVPYSGAGPAITALLGGHVDALATGPGHGDPAHQGRQAARARGLGREALDAMPDLPTLKELGYDAEFYIWSGLFAPAGTPAPVLATLRHAATRSGERPAVQDRDGARSRRRSTTSMRRSSRSSGTTTRSGLRAVVQKIGKVEEKK